LFETGTDFFNSDWKNSTGTAGTADAAIPFYEPIQAGVKTFITLQ
jgi:hypothetical protein